MRRPDRVRFSQLFAALVVLSVFLVTGCQSAKVLGKTSDKLYQVSVLNALMLGEYDGFVPVGELVQKGDVGIGTFDTLDGEMILLDGVVYKATANGTVVVPKASETVPFGAVTWFDADITDFSLSSIPSLAALKIYLDSTIGKKTQDFNCFYVVIIEGSFPLVQVRSVPAQTKPYQRLSAIAEKQTEFVYENLEGTIVAVRCPEYMEGVNLPGWHLHFISKDRTKGGHLLNALLANGKMEMDIVREFELALPSSVSFSKLDVSHDLKAETTKVEGKE